MAAQPDQQAAATSLAAYQAQTVALRSNLTAFLTRLWASLGTYGSAQVAVFAAQALPVIAGAQQKMAALTAASLAAQKQAMLGGSFAPVAVDPAKVSGAAVRNGTAPAEVYGRPFHLVWRQLADLPHEDGAIEQAIQAGLDRTIDLALTDVQLAKTHTAQQILSGDKHVVGFRRVLEGPYSCGLCCVAATLRYHGKSLMPIHPQCDCAVEPIWGTEDPGLVVSAMVNVNGQVQPLAELSDIHQRIKDQFGTSSPGAREIPGALDSKGVLKQYRDALISHDHGELGPILAVRGRPYTGPHDLTK